MKHEIIIKCPKRGKIRIECRFDCYFDYRESRNVISYNATVWQIEKGKRKEVVNNEAATISEIYQAKLELWEMLKPI